MVKDFIKDIVSMTSVCVHAYDTNTFYTTLLFAAVHIL